MTPINKYNNTCTQLISSSCVKWPDTVTLLSTTELCKGDSITDIIYKMSTAIEDVNTLVDLSSLDVSCLGETSLGCTITDVTVPNVLDCIIKNHCALADRVDTLSTASIFGDIDFTCSTEWAILTSPLGDGYTDEDLINYILALICENYTRTNNDAIIEEIADLTERIATLEAITVTETDDGVDLYASGCAALWTGTTTLAEAINYISVRLISLEEATLSIDRGADLTSCDAAELNTVACTSTILTQLNTWGVDTTDMTDNSTLEQKIDNLYKINCALVERMSTEYDQVLDCCRISCTDIAKDLFATRTTTGYLITITFDGSSSLPSYVSSCGTTMTLNLTDANGASASINVNLSDFDGGFALVSTNPRISSIDFTTDVVFELSGCFRITNTDDSTADCFICESVTLGAASTTFDCEVCTFTIFTDCADPEDLNVEVVYMLSGQIVRESMIVTSDTFTLPSTATVVSVTNLDPSCDILDISGYSTACSIGTDLIANTTCYTINIPNSLNSSDIDDWFISKIDGEAVATPAPGHSPPYTAYAYDPTYMDSSGAANLTGGTHIATEDITCDIAYTATTGMQGIQAVLNTALTAASSTTEVTLITRRDYTTYGVTTIVITAQSGKDIFLEMKSTVGTEDEVCIKAVEQSTCDCTLFI